MSESPPVPPATGHSTDKPLPTAEPAVAADETAAAMTGTLVEAPPTAPASISANGDIPVPHESPAPPESAPAADVAPEPFEDVVPAAPVTPSAQAAAMPKPGPAEHGIGVLLVNLGTPDTPDAPAIRRYLKEFLSDPRVIENNSMLWKAVLNGVILPLRSRRKVHDYQKIWNRETDESPIKTFTRSQAEKLAGTLEPLGNHVIVDWAMRYANPSIASRLEALIKRGCDRILIMPLYPQYSAATTATVCDEAYRYLMKLRNQPAIRILPPYYEDPYYIEVLASSLQAELQALPFEPDVILASYHGMPKQYVDKGDPYERQCVRTTELLRAHLGVDDKKLMMTFQSRFGRAKWLSPYTIKTVKALAKKGVKNLVVMAPGFAADCLETLEEIAVENARMFKRNGGQNFALIPCLNDSEAGMLLIWELAMRELKGWV
jgi:protoporphyrin/coproporphyrin ferrochelatase